jgi:hypothetical protein
MSFKLNVGTNMRYINCYTIDKRNYIVKNEMRPYKNLINKIKKRKRNQKGVVLSIKGQEVVQYPQLLRIRRLSLCCVVDLSEFPEKIGSRKKILQIEKKVL